MGDMAEIPTLSRQDIAAAAAAAADTAPLRARTAPRLLVAMEATTSTPLVAAAARDMRPVGLLTLAPMAAAPPTTPGLDP